MTANRRRSREIRDRMAKTGESYSTAARQIAAERSHAGLGLPCTPCSGPCRIDDQPAED